MNGTRSGEPTAAGGGRPEGEGTMRNPQMQNALRTLALASVLASLGTPAALTAPATPGVVVVQSVRVDDVTGDLDGYADTNETVDLHVTLSNKTGQQLTNVVAQLTTSDPKIGCILVGVATIGVLPAAGAEELPPFRIRVAAGADRSGPTVQCVASHCSNFVPGTCTGAAQCLRTAGDEYAAAFRLDVSSDQWSATSRPVGLVLELDLNATSPVVSTAEFVEGFESGFG